MEADIRKWVAQCPECQRKQASLKEKAEYHPIEVSEPFELVTTKKVEQMVRTEEVNRGLDKQEETFKVVHKNVAKKQEAVRKRKMKKGEIAELLLRGDQMEFDVTEEGINSIRTQM
ncbi:unnamed protein product [Arctogadus glacialis]